MTVRSLDGLSFASLRRGNVERCEQIFHPVEDWSAMDWLGCVTGELGEAAGLIKRLRRGEDVPTEEIGKEIADTVIYLDLLAARLGIDLGAAVRQKFSEVSLRRGSTVHLERGIAWRERTV